MGMRGPHATPFLSLWRPQPKPLRKRRCRRCNELFKPKRRDAVFCCGECRTAIYRMRLADAAKTDSRPIFTASFIPESGINGPRAFKALLKIAVQKYGLRAAVMRKEEAKNAEL